MGEIGIGMASISHSPVGTSASEFLRSSSNGVNGIPLRTLGRARFGSTTRRDLVVAAKIRKVKKQDHPWPDDPDPNVKGGVLTHLSYFKPLPENQKPKPVTLEFEKRLLSLEKKITDVNHFLFFLGDCSLFIWVKKIIRVWSNCAFVFECRCGIWQTKLVWTSVISYLHWRVIISRFDMLCWWETFFIW